MARLQVHGHEIFRFYVESGGNGDSTNWEKKTTALMSDGVILNKLQVRFRPSEYDIKMNRPAHTHDYGWKKGKRIDIAMRRQALREQRDKFKLNPKVTIEVDLLGETPCQTNKTSAATPGQSNPVGSEKSLESTPAEKCTK